MRNLCTIQTIKELEKIPGKDRILYASFENVGFRVIVDTNNKIGDKVIYCEADSILPVHSVFEFLRARCFNDKWNGFRIRNMKMSSLYSQGIVFPLTILEQINPKVKVEKLKDGDDITDVLGVIKYDPELLEEQRNAKKPTTLMNFIYRHRFLRLIYMFFKNWLAPRTSYSWPSWASKSDETRAQSLNYIYEKYAGLKCYATEKLDGQSALYAVYKKKFIVCSRNINLKEKKNNYWNYAIDTHVESVLKTARKEYGIDLYIQGELCGPGIQGNKYVFTKKRLFIFNIKDITNDRYFSNYEITLFCHQYGFEKVPFLEAFTFNFKTIDEMLKYAEGYSVHNPKTLREGVVIRSVDVLPPDRGQSNMLSFKVINPSFDITYKGD